ncbi:hypothetical protein ABGB17_12620 [Sphaerisporangium sp. B11E5]|uniref:hypothetical protein n=1 Tax=Sphaerisporangium sp. B11E5 TaxID=3153563 RepID=UPI00325E104C
MITIPPESQGQCSTGTDISATVVEVPGSHAIFISHPEAVTNLIKQAATAT